MHKRNLQNLWVHAQLVWANVLENTHYLYAQEIKTGHRETITLAFKKTDCPTRNLQYLISAWSYMTERSDCIRQEDANQYHWPRLPNQARSCWLKSKTWNPDKFSFFLLVVLRGNLQRRKSKGDAQKRFTVWRDDPSYSGEFLLSWAPPSPQAKDFVFIWGPKHP